MLSIFGERERPNCRSGNWLACLCREDMLTYYVVCAYILQVMVISSQVRRSWLFVGVLQRGGCLSESLTEFIALVSSGQPLSSVAGMCHDFEMMVLHDMLSPASDVATGVCLSLLGGLRSKTLLPASRAWVVSEARLRLCLSLRLANRWSRASTVSEA